MIDIYNKHLINKIIPLILVMFDVTKITKYNFNFRSTILLFIL